MYIYNLLAWFESRIHHFSFQIKINDNGTIIWSFPS